MYFKFLSKDYPIEKSFFIVSRLCLGWMGQYPQKNTSGIRSLNSAFHLVVLFNGVIAQYWYGFYYVNVDLQKGIDAICPAISCMVSFIKMALICWYGKDLSVVLKHLQDLIFTEKSEENKKISMKFAVMANNLSYMVMTSGLLASIFYSLRPVLLNIVRLALGQEFLFDETPLRVMVPTATIRLPWYPITYLLVSYVGKVTALAFSGVDSIFVSFCFYSAALLKILQMDIKATIEQFKKNTELGKEASEICCHQLGNIVKRHNEIIDLIKEFTTFFMWIVLLHFVTSSMVIGASIIEALLYPGYSAIVYLSYTLAVSCELFIYCYGGSEIIERSTGIGTAVYFTNWHNCDIKVKKMIFMIIIRSQKPLAMAVPFFTPSLETFMSIIRTAGSIIAVVKSVL